MDPSQYADVAIHCGDLTKKSTLQDFEASVRLMENINAPLKLVIAGNHDYTMHLPTFFKMKVGSQLLEETTSFNQKYSSPNEVKRLFNDKRIIYLEEGNHTFSLKNGAMLNVFASQYTPGNHNRDFRYTRHSGHEFPIGNVDVVITHGPPKGIFDCCCRGMAGCPQLFEAVARVRPRLHCFGHVHEGRGAMMVAWKERMSIKPTYSAEIDGKKTSMIERLSTSDVEAGHDDSGCSKIDLSLHDLVEMEKGASTLFVNAAIAGTSKIPVQAPWIVDIELPEACQKAGTILV